MKKVVLFDLYDTVLHEVSFRFDKGIAYLHRAFFENSCSFKEMTDYAATFLPLYEKRKRDFTEVCLMQDEVALYFEKFGVKKPQSFQKLEYIVMNRIQQVALTDEVRYTLNELHQQGVSMYILSNSIFTGAANRKLLKSFDILQYFKKVYVSADYGIRKPSAAFFQIAIGEILSDHPGISRTDILYVGNDYVTDIQGAAAVGLDVTWLNVEHLPDDENIAAFDIDAFQSILEIIKQ
ncbi:MAG TPA: HAD family hydrolase [Candidatus Gallacutalibacter stercoravium]|nr:HAD family hydrolase [Candidatus Gallacutalibacter stercoravium]